MVDLTIKNDDSATCILAVSEAIRLAESSNAYRNHHFLSRNLRIAYCDELGGPTIPSLRFSGTPSAQLSNELNGVAFRTRDLEISKMVNSEISIP